MNNKAISVAAVSILLIALVVGLLIVRPALAQVDASSTSTDTSSSDLSSSTTAQATDTTSAPIDSNSSSGTTTTEPTSSTVATPTDTASEPTGAAQTLTSEPAPQGLTLVHIIGTKYIDYFTDGTTITSYPGDANIDAHLGEKDAPIPAHAGLTWVHTTGQNLYDTPGGDLEQGDYAVLPDGSYVESQLPFVSSTSTTPASSTVTSPPTTSGSSTIETSSSTPQGGSPVTIDQSTPSTSEDGDATATTTP